MKKIICFKFFLILLCCQAIFLVTSAYAGLFTTNVEKAVVLMQKANELKKIDMILESFQKLKEVEEILKGELVKDPDNNKALYYLAVCLFYQAKEDEADRKFTVLYGRNQAFGLKIFNFYKNEGDAYQGHGRHKEAINYFIKAYQYQSGFNYLIAQELLKQGKDFLYQGHYNEAVLYLHATSKLDSSLSQEISKIYFDLGQNQKKIVPRIRFWQAASKYGDWHNKEITRGLIELARQAQTAEEKQVIKEHAQLFKKEIKEKVLATVFPPDYKVYRSGVYYFSLKVNESTKNIIGQLIKLPSNVDCHFSSSLKGGKFKVNFKDGAIKDQDSVNGDYYNTSPFEIISLDNQIVKMTITD